jgi:hypothetical protein
MGIVDDKPRRSDWGLKRWNGDRTLKYERKVERVLLLQDCYLLCESTIAEVRQTLIRRPQSKVENSGGGNIRQALGSAPDSPEAPGAAEFLAS